MSKYCCSIYSFKRNFQDSVLSSFNLGGAMMLAYLLSKGVYRVMNSRIFLAEGLNETVYD